MPRTAQQSFASLLEEHSDRLLARWRLAVRQLESARGLDAPALNDHLPSLLAEIATRLRVRSAPVIPLEDSSGAPIQHGLLRLNQGFDLEEVVLEYGVLRSCIHDLAEEHGVQLSLDAVRTINHTIDGAVALAVQAYAEEQTLLFQRRREEHLAFVAHDLRTPLNAIALAATLLEHKVAEWSSDREVHRVLATLQRNVHQLQQLVESILAESAAVQTNGELKVERREFDLWPLVELLVHDLHPLAQHQRVRVRNEVPDDLRVYADAALLRRVLQNLVSNAIRHAPGSIVVLGATGEPDGGVTCRVADTGPGIPEHRLAHIFEEEDAESGGNGLGLRIVKTFVEAHGGEITVESREGKGSEFRFRLPPRQPA